MNVPLGYAHLPQQLVRLPGNAPQRPTHLPSLHTQQALDSLQAILPDRDNTAKLRILNSQQTSATGAQIDALPNLEDSSDIPEGDADSRPYVLIVDDNPHMRSYLIGLLFRQVPVVLKTVISF